MRADDYCTRRVKQSHSSFRLAFLLLDRERRQALNALYTFCREVDDIVDATDDPAAARGRLNDWRAEIESLYRDSPTHLISTALLPAIKRYRLPQEHLQAIIDGMEMDLDKKCYATFDELYLYCYRAAGVVGLLIAAICGYQNRHTKTYAEALGVALQLTNILRDVGEDLSRGRIYIPQDELKYFALTPALLANADPDLDPEHASNLIDLLAFQKGRAERYYQKALTALPTVDRGRQLGGLVMGAIYHALLKQIAREGYPVLSKRVQLSVLDRLGVVIKYLLLRRYG